MKLLNDRGFTLIEMMIVLLIISVLVLIAIPNVTKHSKSIDQKGCNAYVKMVQGQVEAYRMDHHTVPTAEDLMDEEYMPELPQCPDGRAVTIDSDGLVTAEGVADSGGDTD
ncbi:competence type IV pilus major pilin ComGC [Sporosarcina contaminans]|uniref:ComG operon protein 3 n=1 Tax=Sporosarcina contaminans TaxID=633403 RepID=A0ABW3TZX4_9BACL